VYGLDFETVHRKYLVYDIQKRLGKIRNCVGHVTILLFSRIAFELCALHITTFANARVMRPGGAFGAITAPRKHGCQTPTPRSFQISLQTRGPAVGHFRTVSTLRPFRPSSKLQQQHDPLRILLCGSDEFSVASLEGLNRIHQERPKVIKSIDVLCKEDQRTGRGLENISQGMPLCIAIQIGLTHDSTNQECSNQIIVSLSSASVIQKLECMLGAMDTRGKRLTLADIRAARYQSYCGRLLWTIYSRVADRSLQIWWLKCTSIGTSRVGNAQFEAVKY
jgi:hypothetical protein